jgi:hypothetical protein
MTTVDVEKLEKELTHECIVCLEPKTRFVIGKDVSGRTHAIDHKGRKWRDNKCPACINAYKTQWARRKYRAMVLGA